MNNNLIELALNLKKINNSFKKEKFRIIANKNVYNSKFFFFSFILNNKYLNKSPYSHIIYNYFKKAERIFPGASNLLSEIISDKLLGYTYNFNKNESDKKFESIMNYLKSHTDEESFNVFKNLLLFSGPDATITCDSTNNNEILITKNCNPYFEIDIDEDFKGLYFSNLNKTTKEVILSIADAYIERDSDVMRLFELSKQYNNIPIVLICRGISDYAKNFIKQIILNNKIYLYPYISKFNDKDPFLFDDICKLNNQQKVSCESGDILVTSLFDKHKLTKLILEKNKISFIEFDNNVIFNEINNQLNNNDLNKNEEVIKYLHKRKSRISPNNVKILIPNEKIKLLNEIKNLIIMYNISAIYGVYNNKENKNLESVYKIDNIEKLSNSLFNNLNNMGYSVKLKNLQEEINKWNLILNT